MEYLNNLYAQVRDLFVGMSSGNRITVALLGLILVVSFGYLIGGMTKTETDTVFLYNGRHFNHSEMKAAEDALGAASLSDHQWVGAKLRVPKIAWSKYTAAISQAKVITDNGGFLDETMKNFGAYETKNMMDMKYLNSKSKELSVIIGEFGGIEKAIVMPNERWGWEDNRAVRKKVFSASVSVWPLPGNALDETQASAITSMVAPALGITDLREIKIVDMVNKDSWIGSDLKVKGGTKSYDDAQREQEAFWNKKIRELLTEIDGLMVQTTVELDKALWWDVHIIEHAKPTAVASDDLTLDIEKTGMDIYGRPGYPAQLNTPTPNNTGIPPVGATGQSKYSEKREESKVANALQGREMRGQEKGGVPTNIVAAIRIPASHILKTWIQMNSKPGEAAQEPTDTDLETLKTTIIADVRSAVAKIIEPYRRADVVDTTQMVNVSIYTDETYVEPKAATFWQLFGIWLAEKWETLALLTLVGIGLCVLWAMTRVKQPSPIVIYEAAEAPMEEVPLSAEEIRAEEEAAMVRSLEPFSKSSRSLQAEVAELVTENPAAAASVIRQWIGNVALTE